MLQVCVDDSGRGQEPVFVLAGYVGRDRNWIEFHRDWSDLLKKTSSCVPEGKRSGKACRTVQ